MDGAITNIIPITLKIKFSPKIINKIPIKTFIKSFLFIYNSGNVGRLNLAGLLSVPHSKYLTRLIEYFSKSLPSI